MFAVAFFAVAWLTVMGHRGLAPSVAFMAIAVGLRRETWRGAASLVFPRGLRARALSIAAWSGGAFCIWIAITGAWSQSAADAAWLALTVFSALAASGALIFEALNASPRRAARLGAMFSIAVAAGVLALFFEGLSGAYLRDVTPPVDTSPARWKDFVSLGRGASAMAPLVFPASVLIWRLTRVRVLGAAFAPILFVASAQFSIFTNNAAIAAGSLAALVALARPNTATLFVAALSILLLVFAPVFAAGVGAALDGADLPASWAQRVVIWKEAGETALSSCMPLGCGADYARALAAEQRLIAAPGPAFGLPAMPIHPHNAFLQIWLELGVPGVLTLSAAICAAALAIIRARPGGAAAAAICGAAVAVLVSLMTETSIWQAWRLSILCLAAFGAAMAYGRAKA